MRTHHDPIDSEHEELAGFIDRELRRLPELEAPPELGMQILQRIRAQAARPWWRRSFWDWPWQMRLPAGVMFMALATALVWGLSTVSLGALFEGLQGRLHQASPAWQTVTEWLAQAGHFYQHRDLGLWMWGGALLGTFMFLMMMGAVTALLRLSAPRTRSA